MNNADLLPLTANIVTAYLSGNRSTTSDLLDLIRGVHSALTNVAAPAAAAEPAAAPAVGSR